MKWNSYIYIYIFIDWFIDFCGKRYSGILHLRPNWWGEETEGRPGETHEVWQVTERRSSQKWHSFRNNQDLTWSINLDKKNVKTLCVNKTDT